MLFQLLLIGFWIKSFYFNALRGKLGNDLNRGGTTQCTGIWFIS